MPWINGAYFALLESIVSSQHPYDVVRYTRSVVFQLEAALCTLALELYRTNTGGSLALSFRILMRCLSFRDLKVVQVDLIRPLLRISRALCRLSCSSGCSS